MADNSDIISALMGDPRPTLAEVVRDFPAAPPTAATEYDRHKETLRQRYQNMPLREFPNELGRIGLTAWTQMTDPRMLPRGSPLAWHNALSGLLRDLGQHSFRNKLDDPSK